MGIIILVSQTILGTISLFEADSYKEIFVDKYGNNRFVFNGMVKDLTIYYIGHIAGLIYGSLAILALRKANLHDDPKHLNIN